MCCTGEFKPFEFVNHTYAHVRCSKSIALDVWRRLWRGIVTCAGLPRLCILCARFSGSLYGCERGLVTIKK